MRCYLAIDIGASSGRHIVGWMQDGALQTEEVYRFPNGMTEENGRLTWDLDRLNYHVASGVELALERFPQIESLAIDTWGVDYVLLRHGTELRPCYAYRDARGSEAAGKVHRIIPFSELYRRTGCQFQPFNSIYQLYGDLEQGRLEQATDLMMMPEYLLWKLCGASAREYTNATTTGLVSGTTGEYDEEVLSRLGFPGHLFPKLSRPGTAVGTYKGIRCILCATHDTASAVEGIPMAENAPYISSGTWSLLGVKTSAAMTDSASEAGNWSNEGGVGYNRYQKNIMGMWLVNELKKELCPASSFAEVVDMARGSNCVQTVDAASADFLAPKSMKAAFDQKTGGQLHSAGDYFRCACASLARGYGLALEELERNTGETFDKIYIVGGGAKNQLLNEMTAAETGKEIIALPIEATVLGNLKLQMEESR